MPVKLINPANDLALSPDATGFADAEHNRFPIIDGVPRICEPGNYTDNFGTQWNAFRETQLDRQQDGLTLSEDRFFASTGWSAEAMADEDVLEVGSGAGRFSRVVLERTRARLWSVDFSNAVAANYANNSAIAPERFHLFQASIYEMPFPDGSFDKVFCLGVLQHTPDFDVSVRALIAKAKIGGEIVVDFYPIRGWWTKMHAKYILRPITKRMSHERLLRLIKANAGWLISASRLLNRTGLHAFTRFLPICDIKGTLPAGLSAKELREWVVLDTFDMFSPTYDNPQRINSVAAMFERHGAKVTFADNVLIGQSPAAIVRGVRLR
jgi:SAM-dependent methyltransferase